MEFSSTRRPRLTFNLTPLIDVVFLMLVFFLLTSSFVRFRAIEFSFVETQSGPAVLSGARVLVALEADGDLMLDGEPVNLDQLTFTVARRVGLDPGLSALVVAAQSVPLQSTVFVLERLRDAGVADVRLGPEDDDGV